MFYCDPCRETNGWPESMFKSFGPCEECGQSSRCNEVASSVLATWDAARDVLSTPEMFVQRGRPGRKTDAERAKLTEAAVVAGVQLF